MRPLKIEIEGLRSYRKKVEIDFFGKSLMAIVGDTGSGKSSILEAITYALYSATTWDKANVKQLINNSAGVDKMTVSMEFVAQSKRWRVTRSASKKSSGATHMLECLSGNGAERFDSKAEVDEQIRGLVGLSYDTFKSAVILPQGRFQTLLQATPADQTAILKGVFGLGRLERVRQRARELFAEKTGDLTESLERKAELIPDPKGAIEDATKRKIEHQGKVSSVEEFLKQITEAETRRQEAENEVERTERILTRLEADAEAVKKGGDLTSLLPLEEKISSETAELSEQERSVREARKAAVSKVEKYRDAGEDEGSLMVGHNTLERLLKEYPRVRAEEEQLGRVRASLGEEQDKLAGKKQELGAASISEQEAEGRYDAIRREHERLTELIHSLDISVAREVLKKCEERVAMARREEDTSLGEQTKWEQHLARLRDEHAATHLASGLSAGDDCPVCEQKIPEGFTVKAGPSVKAISEAEAELRSAKKAYEASSAKRAEAATELELARARLEAVEEKLEQAKETLRGLLGEDFSYEGEDQEQLLRPLEERKDALELEFAQAREKRKALEAEVSELGTRIRSQTASLEEREKALERDRRDLEESLKVIPEKFRPVSPDEELLHTAHQRLAERLEAVREATRTKNKLDAELEKIQNATRALEGRREEEILKPRRTVRTAAGHLLRSLQEAGEDSLEPLPNEDATLEEEAASTRQLLLRTAEHSRVLRDELGELGERLRNEEERITSVLGEAEASDKKVLEEARVEALAALKGAEYEIERAERDLPEWERLEERIAELKSEAVAYQELAGMLADGSFMRYVVERRQRALLGIASEILQQMTNGRYGFSVDFSVVDAEVGQPRSPRTLSGGETFLAALALALGLMELAGRSGGRLEAFFLDEGFGSLDTETLELALSELDRRARSGRLTALISHVPVVAESIDDVLEVRRTADGSVAQWRDSHEADVDEEIVGAVGGAVAQELM